MPNLILQAKALNTELETFFDELTPDQIDRDLICFLHLAIASPETEGWEYKQRSNAIFLVNRVTNLIHTLHEMHQGNSSPLEKPVPGNCREGYRGVLEKASNQR